MTHTFAILNVSKQTYNEIKRKLKKAGYENSFDGDVIDMHGIALKIKTVQKRKQNNE